MSVVEWSGRNEDILNFALQVANIEYDRGFDDGVVDGKNQGIVFCMEQPKNCKISYEYLKLQENQK